MQNTPVNTKDDKEFTVVKILAILPGSKGESQFGPLRGEQAATELPRDWILIGRSTQCSSIHYLLDEEIHIGDAFSELTDPLDQRGWLEEQVKQHNKKREATTSKGKGPKDDDDESYEVNLDENFLTALGYRMPSALGMTLLSELSNEVGFPVTNTSFDALLESLLSTAKPFPQSARYWILAS
ncbi:hypothetical protein Tco_0510495 [Tanacetum coccineum]